MFYVILCENVNETCWIHQIIDPRKRIPILYRDPIQLAVIDAHTLRTILFVGEEHVLGKFLSELLNKG